MIPEASKTCLSHEAVQHVYEAVLQNQPVDPFNTNQSMSLHADEIPNQNPYTAVMTDDFNTCGLYQRFEGLNCCVGEPSEEYCDRFEEVSAFLSMTKLFNQCSEEYRNVMGIQTLLGN